MEYELKTSKEEAMEEFCNELKSIQYTIVRLYSVDSDISSAIKETSDCFKVIKQYAYSKKEIEEEHDIAYLKTSIKKLAHLAIELCDVSNGTFEAIDHLCAIFYKTWNELDRKAKTETKKKTN